MWVVVITDVHIAGLERLQQLFDVMTEEGYIMRTHIYRVIDGNDAFETLKEIDLKKSEDKRILLDLPASECEVLLRIEASFLFIVANVDYDWRL